MRVERSREHWRLREWVEVSDHIGTFEAMVPPSSLDPEFDFWSDCTSDDPDNGSPTLKMYHQVLWSKPLPSGRPFTLEEDGYYLSYRTADLEIPLSSDAALPTWSHWVRMSHIMERIPDEEVAEFYKASYQLGGFLLFPRNSVDGHRTINVERGFNPRIADRFDLTVECIRLFYLGRVDEESNPLGPTLARYPEFFALFDDFRGYVNHFLLQDLVTYDYAGVNLFHASEGFTLAPRPSSIDEYRAYRDRAVAFVRARNQRMLRYVVAQS